MKLSSCILALLYQLTIFSGEPPRIENKELEFSFVLPEGFVEDTRPQTNEQVLYSFKKETDQETSMVILIHRLGQQTMLRGTI